MIRTLLIAGILLTCLFGAQGYAETVEGCLEKYGNDVTKRLECYDDIARQRQKSSNEELARQKANQEARDKAAGDLAKCTGPDRLGCYDEAAQRSWLNCLFGSTSWIKESPGSLNACNYFFEDTERLNGYDKLVGRPTKEITRSYLSNKWQLDPIDEKSRLEPKDEGRLGRLALAYRQNYILFGTYNFHPDKQLWESENRPKELQDYEAKFQLSLKLRIWKDILGDWERHLGMHIDLWLAYTQLSFWQVYNASISRPFRETNYEPELILNGRMDKELFDGFKLRFIQFVPINHQSNGQSYPLSRSWNRSMLNFGFEWGNFDVVLKTWYRWPESTENDDNADIESYLGYGEISAGYIFKNIIFNRDIRVGLMFRNNLRFDNENRSALQLGVEWHMIGPFNLYVQYFTGYGESLINYNSYANTIGAGVSIKDW